MTELSICLPSSRLFNAARYGPDISPNYALIEVVRDAFSGLTLAKVVFPRYFWKHNVLI